MIVDPLFYAVAVPAVAINGLSKGGFGGAFGFASVPMMALVMSPVQAAGIMLPILIVMDVVAVSAMWRDADRSVVTRLLPWGIVGIALGWLTASVVSDDAVRLLVGLIALAFLIRVFVADQARRRRASAGAAAAEPDGGIGRKPSGAPVWGALAGYTSFVAHAGGPPYQTYVVPLRMSPLAYSATSAVFFAIVNLLKVVPYAALGQLDLENLTTGLLLFPIAIASTWAGIRVARVIDERVFYRILYVSIGLIAVKLIWDGVAGLGG
jgi:uncharacterized membrane protein YfcA